MSSIALIGAGFTGSILATHLLRAARFEHIMLFERSGRFGPGLAYSTPTPVHYLNVPAGRMSAFDDDPEHFLRFARERDPSVQGGSFVPRALYGQYLSQLLDAAQNGPRTTLRRITDTVVAAHPTANGVNLRLASHSTITVDRAVLAVGNPPPANPPLPNTDVFASPRYTRDPWSGVPAIDSAAPILLIGTSLTMMDMVLTLTSRGHTGPIHAVSRRGLVSQPHRSLTKPYHRDRPGDLDLWPSTARGMFRKLTHAVAEAARKGVDWREVVTSIRHDTPMLWQRLSLDEQRRFLRHLRPYWDTHRHRAAPSTWAGVEAALRTGQLTIHAARLLDLTDTGPSLTATLAPRGDARSITLTAAHVINCTGPEIDPTKVDDPLLQDLLATGVARVDPLHLGLDSTRDYRLINREGHPWPNLHLVGTLQRPLYWECTAVPELRTHAKRCADTLT